MLNHSDSNTSRIRKNLHYSFFGNPKNVKDPAIFHKIALIPLFAWIGLGADGLSSSAMVLKKHSEHWEITLI